MIGVICAGFYKALVTIPSCFYSPFEPLKEFECKYMVHLQYADWNDPTVPYPDQVYGAEFC